MMSKSKVPEKRASATQLLYRPVFVLKVNDAMGKYKAEYNEWYEALTVEEQKVEKERTSTKSVKKSPAPILTATNSIIQAVGGQQGPPTPSPVLSQPVYTTGLAPPTLQPNMQMPAITVPYPNLTPTGQAGQPMLVKVEVVGAAGSQTSHAQLLQPTMSYSVSQPSYHPVQPTFSAQPGYTVAVSAPAQPTLLPAPVPMPSHPSPELPSPT